MEPKRYEPVALVLILLLTLAAYWGSWRGEFLFDDANTVVKNPSVHIESLGPGVLFEAAFGRGEPTNRPLTNLTFALNYYFGGLSPVGYHLVNLLIHLAAGAGLFFLIGLVAPRAGASEEVLPLLRLSTTAVFLLHPLQIQSVTYVSQRGSELAGCFVLWSLYFYASSRLEELGENSSPDRVRKRRMAAGVLFLLALASKETAVVTVPLAFFLDAWFLGRLEGREGRKAMALLAPAAAATILAGVFYMGLFRGVEETTAFFEEYLPPRTYSADQHFLSVPRVILYYASLLLFPLPGRLNVDHDLAVSTSLTSPLSTIPAWIVIVCVTLYVSRAYIVKERRSAAAFLAAWFLVSLAPELLIPRLALVYEHRLYLALAGFALLFLLSVRRLFGVQGAGVLMIFLCLGLTVSTQIRNRAWRSSYELWRDAAAKSPKLARTRYNLGVEHQERGDLSAALYEYRAALMANPVELGALFNSAVVHKDLGDREERMGNLRKAAEHYKRCLDFYEQVRKLDPKRSQLYVNMGVLWKKVGDKKKARRMFEEAVRLNPRDELARTNLGNILLDEGRLEEALSAFRLSAQAAPESARPLVRLGIVLKKLDRPDEALAAYRKALELDPNNTDALINAGALLQRARRVGEAIKMYRRAMAVDPSRGEAHKNLAIALVQTGRYTEAAEEARKTEMLGMSVDSRLKEVIRNGMILQKSPGGKTGSPPMEGRSDRQPPAAP